MRGSRLFADVADRSTPTARLAKALAGLRKPRARHDPVGLDLGRGVEVRRCRGVHADPVAVLAGPRQSRDNWALACDEGWVRVFLLCRVRGSSFF